MNSGIRISARGSDSSSAKLLNVIESFAPIARSPVLMGERDHPEFVTPLHEDHTVRESFDWYVSHRQLLGHV